MTRPVVTDMAERVYSLFPGADVGDDSRGWALLKLASAVAAMFEPVDDVVSDRDDIRGWEVALHPGLAPVDVLPWAAQFSGGRLTPGLPEAEQRNRIRRADGMRRGGVESLIAAVQETLTGARLVTVTERYEDSAWRILVVTYTPETPDAAATLAAAKRAVCGGILVTHEVHDGQSYAQALGKAPTYAEWLTAWGTYDNVTNDLDL